MLLQTMRDKARSAATVVVLGIIALMMALTGLETLTPNPNNPVVAEVNGQDLTRMELNQEVETQRRAAIQQMAGNYDPAKLDEKVLAEQALNKLIERTLLTQAIDAMKLGLSDTQVDQYIVAMPQFQVDGKFDQNTYQIVVGSYGMMPLQFREAVRNDLLFTQLFSGISASEFMTTTEIATLNKLQGQTRDLRWMVLPEAAIINAIKPTDADIQAYYDSHKDDFMTPEQLIAEYVVLDKANLAKDIAITDADIQAEYDLRAEQLKQQAANDIRVAVIQIAKGETRSAEEAMVRAQEVEAKLKAGDSFAALAAEYSDDATTAKTGGDLGMFEPGFFGETFDNTVASLEDGAFSAPIETDYDVQIITVNKGGKVEIPTLASLRDSIVADLQLAEAENTFLARAQELADISFEASDLVQPAEQLGLTVMTSAPFARDGRLAADLTSPALNAAAFSDDVLSLGANSELVEAGADKSVVLRMKERIKPALKPLAEVKPSIIATLQKEQAKAQLIAKTDALLAELKAGKTMQDVAAAQSVELKTQDAMTRMDMNAPQALIKQGFAMRFDGKAPSFATVAFDNGDYGVIELSAVYEGAANSIAGIDQGMLAQALATAAGDELLKSFLRSLREQGKVVIPEAAVN